MDELIKALTILSLYIKDQHNKRYPTGCEHNVLHVHGTDLSKIHVEVVKLLYSLGFVPGAEWDEANNDDVNWQELTQEEWYELRDQLSDCFYSYKYGSC